MADARLEVAGGGGRTVSVDREPFRLGRRSDSDLVLSAGEVSRDHAEIVAAGSGYAVRDRGSRYGTFVNDRPVTEQALADGDRIRLGRGGGAELVFRRPRPAAAAAPPAGGVETAAAADLRQIAALLEGLRALGSTRVLDEVLALVMDSAIAVSGAERGFIMLANEAGVLDLKMARARGGRTLPGAGFETSRKIPEEVFRTGRARIEADLLDGDLAAAHAGTVMLGIRHVLCVPLRLMQFSDAADAPPTEDGQGPIGVLYLDSRDRAQLLSPATEGALETLANEAAVAIRNAELYRTALENAKLEREMQTAAEIQRALLPNRQRAGDFFEAAAATLPCRSIGGDFFDYIDRPDGALAFALGDVAGKGPPAALLAALMQGSLAANGAGAGSGPAATMATANAALVRRGVEGRFVTLFYGLLYPDGRLVYCNAGHNAPALVTAGGIERLETGGMVVGLFEDVPFAEGTARLAPGDYLVLFSDGVPEAMNATGEEYGDARLLDCLDRTGTACEPRLQAIFASVERFTAGAPQHDDVTAMVVTYRPRASAAT